MNVSRGAPFKGSKPSEREGRHDPKFIGEISGFPVGSRFVNRAALSGAGVHAPLRAGIHGNKVDGAYSVVLSYGYEDDEDHGETFIYTGQGGRDTNSSKLDKMQGKESWSGHQASDQEWKLGNKALQISHVTGKPVRVIRGAPQKKPGLFKYAPPEGLRYDGLYRVTHAWKDEGVTGFKTCKFRFERLPNQLPLPGQSGSFSNASTNSFKRPFESSNSTKSSIASFSGPTKPSRIPHVPRPPYRPSAADLAKLKSHSKSASRSHPFTPKHASATSCTFHPQQSTSQSQQKVMHNPRLSETDTVELKSESIPHYSPDHTRLARGISQPKETYTSIKAKSISPELEAPPSPSPEPEGINCKRPRDVSSNLESSEELERWRDSTVYVESDEESPVYSECDDDQSWATLRGNQNLLSSGYKKRKI
ncbi:hypothetical protein H2248_008699 [Termitomyces sp. 'cryptogamus']|nr:hypothetical protein H2248_008699 [Termitomyces sp. 'cryptogamus']